MKRCPLTYFTLILALLVPAVLWHELQEGMSWSWQGFPHAFVERDSQPVSGYPKDPLDKGGAKEIMSPSHWQARGRDENGNEFEGYLVVERAPEGYMRRGHFAWQAEGGGGRYHFEGTFVPGTRVVRWSGYSVEDRFGFAVAAHYEATLSPDGRRFENGRWSGGISIPGTWTAEYIGE